MARNSVFDCHLSPNWRQMAIKNSVSNCFFRSTFFDSINVFYCRLSGVIIKLQESAYLDLMFFLYFSP